MEVEGGEGRTVTRPQPQASSEHGGAASPHSTQSGGDDMRESPADESGSAMEVDGDRAEGEAGSEADGGDADSESGEDGGGEGGMKTIAYTAEPLLADGGEGGGGEGGGGEVEGGVLAAAKQPRSGSRNPAAEAYARGEIELARALSTYEHPAKKAYERGDYEAARALAKGGDGDNATVPDGVSPGDTMTVEDLAGALTDSLDEKVLKRLCIANEVHCSSKATSRFDREKELLQRLQSVAKHGRPGPCPRCESILRVVSDDDGLRLECPMWRGGQGQRKPCGACAMPRSLAGRPAY